MLDGEEAQRVLDLLRDDAERAYAGYAEMLNEDASGAPIDPARPGLARELARINLTLGFYTQWYWKTDLHNLMNFLSLRADPHAQYEIRAYAEAMLDTLKRWVPMAYAAFLEYRHERGIDLGHRPGGDPPDARRRNGHARGKRPLRPRMARADGVAGPGGVRPAG